MISKRQTLGRFAVISIMDEFTIVSDLQELDIFIDGLIAHGTTCIAIRFDKISYIYSGALSILLKKMKKLRELGGDICLLEPNHEVDDVIRIANLHNIIKIFHSDDELLAHQGCPCDPPRHP